MPCHGNADTHCCWITGEECPYVEENTVPGRRWACGLRRVYGDWDLVLSSPEYTDEIGPHFAKTGINCRDWPDEPEGIKCTACGFGCDQ